MKTNGLAASSTLRVFLLATSLLAAPAILHAQVAAPPQVAEKGKMVFCTDLSYPPWALVDPQSTKPAGVEIELAAAISETMGIKSEHKNVTFQGLIPALQAGQCDAIISALMDKPERREVVDFVNYAMVGDALFVPVDRSIFFEKLTDLSGLKVVVQTGTTIEQDLQKANDELKASGKPLMQIVSVPNNVDAMQQLLSGLVDAYFGGPEQAAYFDSQMPGKIKMASKIFGGRPIGIATQKTQPEMHKAIEAAFGAIRASGEYEGILKKAKLEASKIP